MTRLLIVGVLIVAGAVGYGFYYGYFRIGANNTDGTTHIELTMEQKKIQDDERKAREKVQGAK